MDVKEAHKHSKNHRQEILMSHSCSCFYCLESFSPNEIIDWTDNGQTAFCPKCEVDAVIGSASGIDLSNSTLRQMHEHWFA
ncbi:cytoplasmic protein [Pseudomonas putida]|uniref:Cytoplasmic protein n=1 Tax=Pseudomonas putida TaxID=303 RepID=A0A8I1EG94_PSEPU|nr:cytoplasmic protein [Pseudomonas putida]MBI6885091.1 cytoplasmic protein [Pseudomonas putida]